MLKGFLLAALASCSYGFGPFFALPLMADGIPSMTILFSRFAISAVILGLVLSMRGVSLRVSKADFIKLSGISTLYSSAAASFFFALYYLDSGIVATVHFCYPVLVVLMMVLFFNERFKISTLTASLLSFAGVAMFSLQSSSIDINMTGMALTLLCAFFAGMYVVTLQVTKINVANSSVITFYVLTVGASLLGIIGFTIDGLVIPHEPMQWVNIILLAVVTAALSNLALVASVKIIGSSLSAILGCLEPVTAMLIGVFVFHEVFSLENAVGMVLIMSSVFVIAITSHRQNAQIETLRKQGQ
ncbi:MAG: DMT family transporter [Pseudomonadota bacterium]